MQHVNIKGMPDIRRICNYLKVTIFAGVNV